MNRFIPDSLLEALLRPFAMGAPNAWVYIEILAPDFRFAPDDAVYLCGSGKAVRRFQEVYGRGGRA